MLIGYARVSTADQNLELRLDALTHALEMLRAGDTLVVWKVDRLGRSVKHLVDLISELRTHGAQFQSLTDTIDTRASSGRFFFHVMASLA